MDCSLPCFMTPEAILDISQLPRELFPKDTPDTASVISRGSKKARAPGELSPVWREGPGVLIFPEVYNLPSGND